MQKLLLTDYRKIKRYLDEANYEGYNSNFVTMMMWDHEYEIFYEINDHYLIMLHTYLDKHFFSMPFCKKEYYREAVDYMIEYANNHDFEFKIELATTDFIDEIKKLYNDRFLYLHNEDYDDYIYSRDSLATLSGKKMQKRRNHFNAFIKEYPDYIYKEIEDKDIDNVLSCLKKWDFSHQIEESVISEYIGIVYLLVHREELNIKTGCIYINNQLEAFIIGSPLNHKTIQIHVEKANKGIRGLYVAIGKFFLDNNYLDYELVNREEDMGLDSLRKAKQMLHPIKMIEKYNIVTNNLTCLQSQDKDLHDIMDLWRDSFSDEDNQTTNFYFMKCYHKENTYLLKNNNELVSMLQIVPYQIKYQNQLSEAYFILGVATNKDYQKQGMMKKLMNYTLNLRQYKDKNILLQAYNNSIYYSFGFKESYYHNLYKIDKSYYQKEIDLKVLDNYNDVESYKLYNDYIKKYDGCRIRNKEYFSNYLVARCKGYNDEYKIYNYQNHYIGYVIYHEDDDNIKVSELIYKDQESLDLIVTSLCNTNKDLFIEIDNDAKLHGDCTSICTMMTNFIKNYNQDNNFFINECL